MIMGCRGDKDHQASRLDEMIPTVTAQIAETLLGIPSRSLGSAGEPPILGTEGREKVVFAVDEVAFASTVGEKVKPSDIRRVTERVNDALDRTLKRRSRKLISVAATFPPTCPEVDSARTVLAGVTPFLLQTGGPEAAQSQKREALLMARLTLTDARTGQSLAVREFFTGYTIVNSVASRKAN